MTFIEFAHEHFFGLGLVTIIVVSSVAEAIGKRRSS